MTLLEKAETTGMGAYWRAPFNATTVVDLRSRPLPPIRGEHEPPAHEVTLHCVTRFFSYELPRGDLLKVAERSLIRFLYGDLLNKIDKVKAAVLATDPATAIATIEDIKTSITKGEDI